MVESKPLVLVVEDNEVVRAVAILNLKKFGVATDAAQNGLEAVEKFKRGNYDLILMDISMPKMDGLQACELMREIEQESKKHVPIIAITAAGTRSECLEAGMDDFITKPADYERVLRKWLPAHFSTNPP